MSLIRLRGGPILNLRRQENEHLSLSADLPSCLYVCVFIYVCIVYVICMYVCRYSYAHACLCTCMWISEASMECFLQWLSTLLFETGFLTEP